MGWRAVYYIFAFVTLIIGLVYAFFYTDPEKSKILSTNELQLIHKGKSEAHIKTKKFTPYMVCIFRIKSNSSVL